VGPDTRFAQRWYVTGVQLEREEHTVLSLAAVLSLLVVLYLIVPVGAGILLGAFLAFMAQPSFERLCVRVGARAAAALTVVGAALGLAALFGGLGWILVVRGTVLAQRVVDESKPGGHVDRALQTLDIHDVRARANEAAARLFR